MGEPGCLGWPESTGGDPPAHCAGGIPWSQIPNPKSQIPNSRSPISNQDELLHFQQFRTNPSLDTPAISNMCDEHGSLYLLVVLSWQISLIPIRVFVILLHCLLRYFFWKLFVAVNAHSFISASILWESNPLGFCWSFLLHYLIFIRVRLILKLPIFTILQGEFPDIAQQLVQYSPCNWQVASRECIRNYHPQGKYFPIHSLGRIACTHSRAEKAKPPSLVICRSLGI